ncbi:MAG TPA: hypothetical protein VH877_26315 [Polyangia bacterium]|jgi:hypothetical protein|nr:hypothetical protein [Polyangia bacterium]
MDTTSTLTVFTMEIDELRQRVETACETITRVRTRLRPHLKEMLSPMVQAMADADDDGENEDDDEDGEYEDDADLTEDAESLTASPEEGAGESGDVTADPAEREEAFAALGECIELVTALLPGLVSLTPEERERMDANRPDVEAMDEFLENYVPPPRLPDTAPTAEELMVEEARELGQRSALIGKVRAAFEPLVHDLIRVHDLLNLRLGRFGVGTEPPAGNN